MITKREIRDWNQRTWERKNHAMYATHGQNKWPWFYDRLDPDIEQHLRANDVGAQDILDVGTCGGSQAIELARRGHRVVATEISDTALAMAQRAAAGQASLALRFLIDDIAESRLEDDRFDIVIDRGCYHSICSFDHEEYVSTLRRVLRPRGALLFKAMSSEETRFVSHEVVDGRAVQTPFHFTAQQLRTLFSPHFTIELMQDSFFHSSVLDAPARAHFLVLRNTQ
jgi:SAM-dependent methyltransferase